MSQIWVKVCGLTNTADVESAVRSGADAVGLVLVEESPRLVDVATAVELTAAVGDRAEVVLLVEGEVSTALDQARIVGARLVQPYGAHAAEIATAALGDGLGALLPVPVAAARKIEVDGLPRGARPLLDTAVPGTSGGTGRSFDWAQARGVPGAVIAGGLGPDNVASAVRAARPWGVDASSRLEAEVGRKDHSKVAAFIAAARSA